MKLLQSSMDLLKGRSTVTNLACFTQYVAKKVDDRIQVDVIYYTDFQKTFDQIDLNILIKKLKLLNISHELIMLFKSYLFNRQQFVEYMGHRSNVFIPSSGVPQGSNLGPLLFIIFINDIVNAIKSCVHIYADDMKVYRSILSTEDCQKLQADIESIVLWCHNNKLNLNIDKCKVMTYTNKSNSIEYTYKINETNINRCNKFKDLGILFDAQLNFCKHVELMVTKAFRTLGFIIRSCRDFSNLDSIKILYYAYVRSTLEYGSIIWIPIYQVHIDQIESVQRRFLK